RCRSPTAAPPRSAWAGGPRATDPPPRAAGARTSPGRRSTPPRRPARGAPACAAGARPARGRARRPDSGRLRRFRTSSVPRSARALEGVRGQLALVARHDPPPRLDPGEEVIVRKVVAQPQARTPGVAHHLPAPRG